MANKGCFGAQISPMCCNFLYFADDYSYMVGPNNQQYGPYCWEEKEVIVAVDIANRWTQLTNNGLLFDGLNESCGNDTPKLTLPAAKAYVKAWIEQGGKYYVAGEYQGCLGVEGKNKLNTWMMELGVSLRIGDPLDVGCNNDCGPPPLATPRWKGVINNVNVTKNCDGIFHAGTNFITGGTPLCRTQLPDLTPGCSISMPFVSIEKLGKGWVCLAGDSNLTQAPMDDFTEKPCSPQITCQLFRNMLEMDEWI